MIRYICYMIRTKRKSAKRTVTIEIPNEYIGKDLEILVFTSEEIKDDTDTIIETHIVSEPLLSKEWNNAEEDEAWKDL